MAMQKIRRLTALFLAALMVVSVIGAKPAEAAEKYTVSVENLGPKAGTVTINGKEVTSLSVEAGTRVTIKATPGFENGIVEVYGKDGASESVPDANYIPNYESEDGTATLSFTMPEYNVGYRVFFSGGVNRDLGTLTVDLTGGKTASYSGVAVFLAIAGNIDTAIENEKIRWRATPVSGPQETAAIDLDMDDNDDVWTEFNLTNFTISFQAMPTSSIPVSHTVTVNESNEDADYYGKVVFVFSPISIAKASVTVKDQTYTGKALTPAPTVKLSGVTLKKGTDYSVTYKNNTNAGTATVTIKGKPPYTGTVSKTFTIKPASISKATVGALAAKTYTGSALKPAPTVKFGGKTLKNGTDYTVSYKNNVNAGTATAVIKGKGNFTGSVSRTFAIKPASLKAAKITGLKDMLYTGKAITQTPVVKLGTKTLKAGTDYMVKYAKNTNVGKAAVTVTGKGNYVGSAQATFKIMDPVEEFVARLYRVCLDREPEAQGHAWWVAGLRGGGETGGSCAWGFFDSTEFKNHKYSNSAFLDHAYAAFFDRKPDAAGKAWWLGEMKKGMTREQVIKSGFAVSNEWKALCKTYQIKP